MVAIHPFRALRYDPEVVGGLDRVLAPPYDVIDAASQERLYQASPHNIVRLILGKQSPADTDDDNRYTRARRDFDAWRSAGALKPDPEPALYVVEHGFADDGGRRARLGFLALLDLSEASARGVLRHEATLDAPKQDRAKLLEALPANLSPVFCVYPDPDGQVHALVAECARQAPSAQGALNGEPLRVWAVLDPAAIARLTQSLARGPVLIADGHHRFEVAYANRQRYGKVMCYFVSMADPSLVMRPIHRILQAVPAQCEALIERSCVIEPSRSLEETLRWLSAQEAPGCYGLVRGGAGATVQVTPEALEAWVTSAPVPEAAARLDVSILHGLLLPGIPPGPPATVYTADAREAAAGAADPEAWAWLLRPLPVATVFALASQGVRLPPKSTFFYPKVPSGLAINPLG